MDVSYGCHAFGRAIDERGRTMSEDGVIDVHKEVLRMKIR